MGNCSSKLSEKSATVRRFRADVRKDTEHENHSRIPPQEVPTALPTSAPVDTSAPILNSGNDEDETGAQSGSPAVDNEGLSATAPSTPSPVENIVSAVEGSSEAISEDEEGGKLPTTIATANDRLDKAAEKFKTKMTKEILGSTNFEIKASADISSLAENIGVTLVTMMDKRKVEKSKQTHVQSMVTEWVKKTIPFVETGLTVANVCWDFRVTY